MSHLDIDGNAKRGLAIRQYLPYVNPRGVGAFFCLHLVFFTFSALLVADESSLVANFTTAAETNRPTTWQVEFRHSSFYSISNAMAEKLKNHPKGSRPYTNILHTLENIALGKEPSARLESRTGEVLVAGQTMRAEIRLESISPPPGKQGVIEWNLEVLSPQRYTRKYSWYQSNGKSGEVEIRPKPAQAFMYPPPLIKHDFTGFLLSLTNVTEEEVSGADGLRYRRLKGQQPNGISCLGEVEIDFDPSCIPPFPRRIISVGCGSGETTAIIDPLMDPILGCMPKHVELRLTNDQGIDVYRESWDFFNYRIQTKFDEGAFKVSIPMDYIVNDFTFSRPFAYRMGLRPPTPGELQRMSTDVDAIRKYQRESRLTGFRSLSAIRRIAVLVIVSLLFGAPFLFIKVKNRL